MQMSQLPPEYQHLAHLAAAQHSQLAMLGPLHLVEEANRQAEAAAQAAAAAKAAAASAMAKPLEGAGGGLNEMLETMMKNSVREYLSKELPNILASYAKGSSPEASSANAAASSNFQNYLESQVLQALANGGGARGAGPTPPPSGPPMPPPGAPGSGSAYASFSGTWPAWAGMAHR